MKKILGMIATLVLGSMAALSAKEWTNFAGLGWNLPMDFYIYSRVQRCIC